MMDWDNNTESSTQSLHVISCSMIAFFFPVDSRDFMEGTMEKTNKMLAFLHPIIEEADPELQDFLIRYVLIDHQNMLI